MPDDDDRTLTDLSHSSDAPADDTELIAYLDGELDADAAVRVEARLARDPAARAAAEAYKKSYDLLDYLPTAEPKPDFTSRTITRLRPVVAGAQPLPAASGFVPMLPARRRAWPELLAWTVAAVLVLALGYIGHSVARPLLTPPPAADEPTLADLEVIERLPLYWGVDDVGFLKQLDAADLFGEDAPSPSPPPADRPSDDERAKLIAQFRDLPPARQQQLRALHQELKAVDAKAAPTLLPTLDAYAAWLGRLPDGDRKKVLAAPAPAERLVEIRQVKEAQWRAGLTPRQKERLKTVQSTQDREDLAAEFRLQEFRQREEWELAHRQWQLVAEKGQKPWPFDDPKRVEQIDAYIRGTLGADLTAPPPGAKGAFPDPQPQCRLTREQFVELKTLHDAAKKEGNWSWLLYGACLLRLSDAHPSLPPPREGKPVTGPDTLPREYKSVVLPKFDPPGPPKWPGWMSSNIGRWPDFALAVHDRRSKSAGKLSPLGPCKSDDFAPQVTTFVTDELLPKLTADDRTALEKQAGKWPDYPRRMMELARKHDLPVPGVTLPGPPSQWDKLYRLSAGKR